MGTRHQVVHPPNVGQSDRCHSEVLGQFEAVVVVRSSVLNYNRLSNACFCWKNGVDGVLCKAAPASIFSQRGQDDVPRRISLATQTTQLHAWPHWPKSPTRAS